MSIPPAWSQILDFLGTPSRDELEDRIAVSDELENRTKEYAMRGESENRNKEFKCGMARDRRSDRRFLANYFRLSLHAAALNLLVRLRQEIADPPPAPAATYPWLCRNRSGSVIRTRRRQDRLGEGQPATWRLLLIKVAASVVVSCRIVVRLSSSWPQRDLFEPIGQHVSSRAAGPACWTG